MRAKARGLLVALAAAMLALVSHAAVAGGGMGIVAFGTSLTARGGWQEALAARLGECRSSEVEVHSVAMAGANSDWAVENLDRVVALAPDVVLVEFSINDASLLHGVPAGRSRTNTEAIVARLEAAIPEVQVVLMTMNPAAGLRWATRPFLGDFYQMYRDIARERAVALADLAPQWEAYAGDAAALPDGLHPTPEAARAVIVPALSRLLGGPGCG